MTRDRAPSDEPVGQPISRLRLKAHACVLLVRVEPHEESACLTLDARTVRVLRVRHPLPACERIRVVRPMVVVIGRAVREADVALVNDVARETGSEVVEMGAFARAALREAVQRAVARAAKRRRALAGDDLPGARRAR